MFDFKVFNVRRSSEKKNQKKHHKSTVKTVKTFGVAKSIVWNIQESTSEWVWIKTTVDNSFSWSRKAFSLHQQRSRIESWHIIIEIYHEEMNIPGWFTTWYTSVVTFKNRKVQLNFTRKHLKTPPMLWNQTVWKDKTKKAEEHYYDLRPTTSRVKQSWGGVMIWADMAASGTGSRWCDCWQR